MCKHWKELDDDHRSCFEYCRAKMREVSCCGDKKQCNYPEHYEEHEPRIKEWDGDNNGIQ